MLDDANAMYLRDISNIKFIAESEERELFAIMREHKGTKKAERAREKLIVAYMPLVSKIAAKFKSKGLDLADLIQEGNMGLIRAVDTFEDRKSDRLSTYATTCATNAIINAISKYDDKPKEIYLDDPDEYVELEEDNILNPDEALLDKREMVGMKELIERLLLTLSLREVEIISMRFGIGGLREHTQQEVADFFDISQQAVQQIEQRALEKMKDSAGRVS